MNQTDCIIDRAEFRSRIKTGGGAFVLCGEEEYLKSLTLKEAKKLYSTDSQSDVFNILTVSAFDSADVISDCTVALSSLPMFAQRKMVILRDYNINSSTVRENALRELCGLVNEADFSTTLFIIYCTASELTLFNGKNLSAKAASLAGAYTIVSFEPQTDAKLYGWIEKHFTVSGVTASREICQQLVEKSGHSMGILANEIDKLCHYVISQKRNSVTSGDIGLVCSEYTEYGAFELTDVILSRNTRRALEIFYAKKAQKEEPVLILGTLSKLFTDLYIVSVLASCGDDNKKIASASKIHEFVVGKYRTFITKNSLTPEGIADYLEILSDSDKKLKGFSVDGYEIVERTIVLLTNGMKTLR